MSYKQEQARILKEEGPLKEAAKRFLTKLEDPDRKRGVFGIYGERGSGKTSFLLTLLDMLDQRDQGGPTEGRRYLVPKGQGDRLFAPSRTRDDDQLLFILINFLESKYGLDHETLAKIRKHEVHRQEIEQLIEYGKETSTSGQCLPEDLVKIHEDAAKTTERLQAEFQSLIKKGMERTGARHFILPVDDLDLQPYRACELLELLHLFFDFEGVVILVAADSSLLQQSLGAALARKMHLHSPGLPGKLLAKWIPYPEFLPVPDSDEALKLLFEGETAPPIASLWSGAMDVLERDEKAREEASIDDSKKPPPQPWRQRLWGPLVPRTYRGLIALHNRAMDWSTTLDTERRLLDRTGIQKTFQLPWLTLLLSVDIQFPECNLLGEFMVNPARLLASLRELKGALDLREQVRGELRAAEPEPRLLPSDDQERQRQRDAQQQRQERDLRLAQVLLDSARANFPILRQSEPGEQEDLLKALEHLAEALDIFGSLTIVKEVDQVTLLLSLNNNALERIRSYLSDIPAAVLQRDHIDLTSLRGDESRPSIKTIRQARSEALTELRRLGIPSGRGRLALRAEAPLSLLVWLGWELRRRLPVTVYNFFQNTFIPFTGPAEELRPRDTRQRSLLPPPADTMAEEGEAVLLIDVLGRSTEEQLGRFLDAQGKPVVCTLRRRLQTPPGQPLEQESLLLLLLDLVEELFHLRTYQGVRKIHLGLAGPDMLAFFLGQQLHTYAVVLYEFNQDQQSYQAVFPLADDAPTSGG